MSLVSDIMNKVSPLQQGGSFGAVSGINLNDTTFSNLLDKALNTKLETNTENPYKYLGAPAGFEIQPINTDGGADISAQQVDKNLLDFAKKQAANSYFKYSGSVVTDLMEFVEDALGVKI